MTGSRQLKEVFSMEATKMTEEHGGIRRSCKLTRTSGYTLVEMLLVIMIIAVFAGFVLVAVGSGSSNAEAAKILSDMEAMKTALIMESKQTISRTNDPIVSLVGKSSPEIIEAASKHTNTAFDKKYFSNVSVVRDGNRIILNLTIPANIGEVGDILRKKASQSSTFSYDSALSAIRLTMK
jgi:prepilin-type N-terminal cleavage/methylation domain-containing protein